MAGWGDRRMPTVEVVTGGPPVTISARLTTGKPPCHDKSRELGHHYPGGPTGPSVGQPIDHAGSATTIGDSLPCTCHYPAATVAAAPVSTSGFRGVDIGLVDDSANCCGAFCSARAASDPFHAAEISHERTSEVSPKSTLLFLSAVCLWPGKCLVF